MNKEKVFKKYQTIKMDPEYRKDLEELFRIGDDKVWERKKQEMQKKYGIKKPPTSLTNPQERAKQKIKPAKKISGNKHIPLESFYQARIRGIQELDPPEVKRYFANYQKQRKQQEKFEIPISNEEIAHWEQLRENGKYFELRKEHTKKVETLVLANPDLVTELLQDNPVRKALVKQMGVPFSPLLGFASLTAWVVVRLFGIKHPDLFKNLQDYMGRVFGGGRRKIHKESDYGIRSPIEKTRLDTEFRIQEWDEKLSDFPGHLVESITALPVVSPQAVKAVESYLFTCLENTFKQESFNRRKKGMTRVPSKIMNRRKKDETLPAVGLEYISRGDNLRKEPERILSIIEKAVSEIIFPDPIDRKIAEKIDASDGEIAKIITQETGKSITKQAVQKRRTRRVYPLLRNKLEISVERMKEESRCGWEFPIEKTMEELVEESVREKAEGIEINIEPK